MLSGRRAIRTVAAGFLVLLGGSVLQAEVALEYRVKAAFLYNFAKFVRWSDDAPDLEVFTVGILGVDPFGEALEQTIANKTIEGKPIEIRYFASPRDVVPCRVLFVSGSEDEAVDRVLASLGPGTLTVGETRAFERAGGMIRFVLRGGKVRFVIDQQGAERAGLEISSKLLSVAETVKREP